MNQQTINMREIRDVANRFDAGSIEACIQLAMEQGMNLAQAARELGKRIRSLQNNIPSPLEGEG